MKATAVDSEVLTAKEVCLRYSVFSNLYGTAERVGSSCRDEIFGKAWHALSVQFHRFFIAYKKRN